MRRPFPVCGLDDRQAVGLLDGVDNRLEVEGLDGAQKQASALRKRTRPFNRETGLSACGVRACPG